MFFVTYDPDIFPFYPPWFDLVVFCKVLLNGCWDGPQTLRRKTWSCHYGSSSEQCVTVGTPTRDPSLSSGSTSVYLILRSGCRRVSYPCSLGGGWSELLGSLTRSVKDLDLYQTWTRPGLDMTDLSPLLVHVLINSPCDGKIRPLFRHLDTCHDKIPFVDGGSPQLPSDIQIVFFIIRGKVRARENTDRHLVHYKCKARAKENTYRWVSV